MIEEIKRHTVSGMLWQLLQRGGRAVIELIVQVVMARLLAPEEFGALAVMIVFINIGNVVVQSGLNTALIQSPRVSNTDYSTVFWMSFAMSIVLYVVIFFAAPLVAAFYSMPYLIWPLRALALVLLINALNSVQVARVTRDLEMRKTFVSTISSVVCSAIIGIVAAVAGAGLWALVLQQLTYQTVNCIVMFNQVDWHPKFEFDVIRARELFEFGSRLLASGLLNTTYQSLGDLIIGKQFSSIQLGLVSQGEKYPMAIGNMLDGAIQPVMLSAVSHVQGDPSEVKRLVRRALKTSTYLIAPTMVLFAVVAPIAVPALLGEKWIESVPYLRVYCLVYALLPIHTTNLQALNGMGRSDLFLKLEVIKKTYGLAAVLFSAFVLKSVDALVFSYLVTGIISTFVNSFPNKNIIGYSYREQIRDISPALMLSGASAFMALCVSSVVKTSMGVFVSQVVVYVAFYLGVSRILRLDSFVYLCGMMRAFFGSKRNRRSV